jgi:KDO2-lipid IV(A) lauroyltransferase
VIGLPFRLGGALTVAGHRLGWAAVRRMPERAAYRLFDAVADLTVARGGAERMRANYARVRPELDGAALDALVKEGMRRYLRYYCEAFRLPDLGPDDLAERVRAEGDGPIREAMDGGSVVCFLGHLGNWDLAGAWGSVHLGHVTTVAERLEPEEVFEEFLAFREGLGMTILPLTGGPDVFSALRRALRTPGTIVPLLADRDLTARGVEVEFCGRAARMAAGPALLALAERRPLHPVSIRHERRGDGWGIVITFHPAVEVPATGTTRDRALAMTQECADVLGAVVAEHTEDWHMLQRVFLEDLDPERLSSAEARP